MKLYIALLVLSAAAVVLFAHRPIAQVVLPAIGLLVFGVKFRHGWHANKAG